MSAMTSPAGNITGNSHVKVSLNSLPVNESIREKTHHAKAIHFQVSVHVCVCVCVCVCGGGGGGVDETTH